jgi:hypothetical protein
MHQLGYNVKYNYWKSISYNLLRILLYANLKLVTESIHFMVSGRSFQIFTALYIKLRWPEALW